MRVSTDIFKINQLIKLITKKWLLLIITGIILVTMFISSNQSVKAFSPAVRHFIEQGKNVRLKIKEGIREITITPSQEITVEVLRDNPGKNIFATYHMKKNQNYYIKTGVPPVKYWMIQVFATHNRQQAEKVLQQIEENGFEQVQLKQEDNWFKVELGPFTEEDKAMKVVDSLQADGRQVWLKDYMEERREGNGSQNLNVYIDEGQLLFSGKGMRFQGKLTIDKVLYQGQLEFVMVDNEIDIFYNTNLESVISAMLVLQYDRTYEFTNQNKEQSISDIRLADRLLIDTNEPNMLPLLKAQAVVNRTFLLKNVVKGNKGYLRLDNYPEDGEITAVIKEAVNTTVGQVLQKNELFFVDKVTLGRSVNKLYELEEKVNYQKILSYLYNNTELVDLSQQIDEKIILNAPVKKGLHYKEIKQLTWWGRRLLTMLELDLNESSLKLETFLSQNRITGLQDLAQVVVEQNALVGINGGYYNYSGRPLGLLMIAGKIVSEPVKNRTALGITGEGKVLIDQVKWQGMLTNNNQGKQIKITGVNRPPQKNEAVIINKFFGDTAPALKPGKKEIVVNRGSIQQINEIKSEIGKNKELATKIPEQGFIIQLHGDSRQLVHDFRVGHRVNYKNIFSPDWGNHKVISALGAGPSLVKNGQINITGNEEEFQNDILRGRAPRSAVGITYDNHFLMVVVDGRQPQLSIGISLTELAHFLQKFQVKDAMNLDGGASTRMVVRRFIMNNPSQERLIANGLLVKFAGND